MQGPARKNREWEHWPGRGVPDDGIRHRLRALFSPTDDEAVEALIAERGREIEEQTARLQATITDLERREEQAARLRRAVEEMLRQGSAELDERHAELGALAVELRAREEAVREQERDIAVRKQELGAVELRRAAVERREQAAGEREAALAEAAATLSDREREIAAAERDSAAVLALPVSSVEQEADTHLVYFVDGGYRIVERDGHVPAVGASIDVDGRSFVVVSTRRSVLPGDRRRCAYVEPTRTAAPSETERA